MIKSKELTDPKSCMSRAKDDEPTFVLLARDPAAPEAIRAWTQYRVSMGKNRITDDQIQEALSCAYEMKKYREANAS